MSLISYKRSQTSVILRVKILNSAVSTGAGKTGLAFNTSGLIIAAIADTEATTTAYTAAGGTIETITTLGTFATPTATKCRFRECDATNHPGVYEVQLDNTRYAVTNAKSLLVSISGASGAAECDAVIPLVDLDPYTATVTLGTTQTFNNTGTWTGNIVGTLSTVTTLTNLPAITANWLTAAGIASDAITAAKIADGAIDAATFAAGAINAAAIATDALGAAELSADAVTEIAAAISSGATAAQVWTYATRTLTNVGGAIEFVSPVSADGGTIYLKLGDSYFNSEGRALEWTITTSVSIDLTGATIVLNIMDGALVVTGAAVAGFVSGTTTKVRFEPTAVQTATLANYGSNGNFDVTITLSNGHLFTPKSGQVVIQDSEAT